MARPERNNVDYFPFLCDEGKKMFYLEETYGNDGFATFLKILRELAKTDYHYLDLSKKTTLMFLSAKCKVSRDILESIINDLVELEKFDYTLWHENKIIWCQDFIDSIQDAYKKRNNKCMTYEGLLQRLHSLGIRKPSLSESIVSVNPQRKEKEIIEEKNIVNNTKTEKLKKPKKVFSEDVYNKLLSEIEISDVDDSEKEYFQIAKSFQELFIKNLTEKKSPSTSQKNAKYKAYVNPIRLMMTREDVTREHFIQIFKYLDSVKGDFWKKNILSTNALRKHFSKLILNSAEDNSKTNMQIEVLKHNLNVF